jgi:hypothetical protein
LAAGWFLLLLLASIFSVAVQHTPNNRLHKDSGQKAVLTYEP